MINSANLSTEQYRAIASFRHQLRQFLAFSEAAAAAVGLPSQQHQALLAIAGHVGDDPPTIGALAEQLIIAPHTAAELVARMVEAGLVTKTTAASDRRKQQLALTARAAALLASLTDTHRNELAKLRDILAEALHPSPQS
jgi:DNA-binding MarR family transcriptional regulator